MVKVNTFLLMEIFMKVILLIIIYKVKVNSQIQMEINIMENGKIIKEMVKVNIYI